MWMPWYECLFANSSGASSFERFDAAGNVLVCDKHGIEPANTDATINELTLANPLGVIFFITISEPGNS
jgi:hypothetical protein